ncbi:16282_t:CDS:2 [Gigaspora margarita]|uniref:16282_t:CDS:1 n=1 Tax=Gigaspora margarita TaxID=4874 RepID=A0ABN7ULC8_GIGMA|nr:16282_t:CDS:2 [Gigaspora margarita]
MVILVEKQQKGTLVLGQDTILVERTYGKIGRINISLMKQFVSEII